MKHYLFITLLFLSVLSSSPADSRVRFIVQGPETEYNNVMTDEYSSPSSYPDNKTLSRCEQEGYTKTSCGTGTTPRGMCPYSGMYYKDCCPDDYSFSAAECAQQGKTTSTYSCAGYYACY